MIYEHSFTTEDAFYCIVQAVKDPQQHIGYYGYEVYIPDIIENYIKTHEKKRGGECKQRIEELSPLFYDAAWNLCRRGIFRPGVKRYGAQSTIDANAGNGYSITPFGQTWFSEEQYDAFVPTEPERFARLIEPFKHRFGQGFHQRSQEAIRCYGAHAFLACCVMCGAAAESVLLAIAIAKRGDENEILKMYSSAKGQTRIESCIIKDKQGQERKAWVKTALQGFTGLLKYWRDESAHGQVSEIKDTEAYTSIALLLRFAQFADENWELLMA